MRIFHATALLLALLALPALAGAQAAPAAATGPDARAERAIELIDRLDAGEYADATEHFSARMREALGAEMLEQVWTVLPQQVGKRTGRGTPRHETAGPYQVVVVPLEHEVTTLDARVTFGDGGSIEGFHVVPAAPPPPAPAPEGDDAAFQEHEVRFREDAGALAGTLTLPRAAAPDHRVAAVVLVHGSGPQDRDETIGPNRPFLDIARGLATHGIASLRYDKRTLARPQDFAGGAFTVDHETVDDAVAAVAHLGADPRIDAARIFVVGHSLGAMMAPRIAARAPVAGLVLLAAPARPIEDIVIEQVRHLAALDGETSATEQSQIDAAVAAATRVKALDEASGTDVAATRGEGERLMLDLPAAYWRDLRDYDPVAALEALSLPALVVHGGRDIQVTAADWARWQRAFSGSGRVALRAFPELNHLLIAGDAPSTPAEYFQAGTVDARLIDTIAGWIAARA